MDISALLFDPVLVRAVGAACSVILIAGAVAKLQDLDLFRYTVENYGLLGPAGSALFARLFPLLELAAGVALLVPLLWSVGLLLGWLVLGLATAGVVANLARGRGIECGCGTGGQRISWGLVARNAVLMLALALGTSEGGSRDMVLLDYFSVSAAVLALLALYACINQLLANQPLLKELRHE